MDPRVSLQLMVLLQNAPICNLMWKYARNLPLYEKYSTNGVFNWQSRGPKQVIFNFTNAQIVKTDVFYLQNRYFRTHHVLSGYGGIWLMILCASLSLKHFEKLSYWVGKKHWISEKAHAVEGVTRTRGKLKCYSEKL